MRIRAGVLALVLGTACGGAISAETPTPYIDGGASGAVPTGTSSRCVDQRGAPCAVLAAGVNAERLAVDATNVYWADLRAVGVVPKRGGAPVVLFADVEAPGAIAADSAGVYAGLAGDGAVVSIDAPTRATTTLARVGQAPFWLALDAAHAFVATQVNNVEAPGNVAIGLFQVARVDGATKTLQTGGVSGVAADATGVYWTTDKGLFALRPGLTTPAEVLLMSDVVRRIAVDAANVYALTMGAPATATGQVVRFPKAGGAPMLVADKLSYPTDMVLDDARVYVADFNAGTIVRLTKP